jgi:hypothetical protein
MVDGNKIIIIFYFIYCVCNIFSLFGRLFFRFLDALMGSRKMIKNKNKFPNNQMK